MVEALASPAGVPYDEIVMVPDDKHPRAPRGEGAEAQAAQDAVLAMVGVRLDDLS